MAARSVPLTDVQGIEATRCHDVDRLDTSARPLEVGIIETDDQDDVIQAMPARDAGPHAPRNGSKHSALTSSRRAGYRDHGRWLKCST